VIITAVVPIEGMRLGAALNARVHWTKRAARSKKERASTTDPVEAADDLHAGPHRAKDARRR
jgi:hypothetical protein